MRQDPAQPTFAAVEVAPVQARVAEQQRHQQQLVAHVGGVTGHRVGKTQVADVHSQKGVVGHCPADEPGVGYGVTAVLSVAALQSDRVGQPPSHEGPVRFQGHRLGNRLSEDQVRLLVICLFFTGGVRRVFLYLRLVKL